ncbi:MAG: hypothetical protein ACE5JD_08920 [Candidatus Methylomirabilia bacterium]
MYHTLVILSIVVGALVSLTLLAQAATEAWGGPGAVGGPGDRGVRTGADRLDRFRHLTASRLGASVVFGQDPAADAFRAIYALIDAEILDNLEAGNIFASEAFLQERLDAFNAVWGGGAFRALVLPGGDLTVGSFQLSPLSRGNSVRVYRRERDQAALLATIHRDGVPTLYAMPSTRMGQSQFAILWVGPSTGRGTTAVRVEFWRERGGQVRLAWRFPDSLGRHLYATAYAARGEEFTVRYEVRYPGWVPGCQGQTEREDIYRYDRASERFLLASHTVHNGWHRELHATLRRLLTALSEGDQHVLAELGLDRVAPRDLPPGLEPEPACDLVGPSAEEVTVTATGPGDPHPWAFRFRRTPAGWRLAGLERLRYPGAMLK